MLGHLRANAVAYIALFFGLTGASFAAASRLEPPNSVGTRQVIDHSLLRQDFKPGQVPPGRRGARGPQGAQGAQGAQGPPGSTNIPAVAEMQLTYAEVSSSATNQVRAFIATGSTSHKCLATLNEDQTDVGLPTLYCSARNVGGVNGLWIHVFLTTDATPALNMWVTVYQEGAQSYGAPTLYPYDS